MERLICLLIGYGCGLFQTSYIYGRACGIDIRDHGSGNAGMTNALRTLGAKAGAITFFGDCFKCVVAVVIVRLLFGNTYPEYIRLLGLYAAAGTILGHNYPFYMKFRGGKGIAATAGLFLSFDWRVTLISAVIFLVVFFTTNYVSMGSLCIYIGFVLEVILMGQMGLFHMEQSYLNELYIASILLACLAFYKHRENIKRLIRGEENKTYLKRKDKDR